MRPWRRFLAPGVALAAAGWLVAMVLSGAPPVQRQLVPFEAKGPLRIAPEQIRRIEVSRGSERVVLVRTDQTAWATPDGRDVGPQTGKRASMAVQMLHTSGPANEIAPDEQADIDVGAFELDPPRLIARLFRDDKTPVLTARFGAHNPDGFLQYMRIDGDRRIYLMSRFVGEEWAAVLNGSQRP